MRRTEPARRRRAVAALLLAAGIIVLRAGVAAAADAAAATIAAEGNGRGAPACASCHGAAGEGNAAAGFPRLAALPAAYLAAQLDALADGRRSHPVMTPVARALNAAERTRLAGYYAALPRPPAAAAGAPQGAAATLGAELALRGRWSAQVPACVQCHGENASGVGDAFPALAGQSAAYVANQLRAFKNGTRPAGPLALMPTIAAKLSDADIEAVAGYLAAMAQTTTGSAP